MPACNPLRRRVLWWCSMLLLAAAINWIVAWACVLWSPRDPWNMWASTSLDDSPAAAVAWGRLRWADDPSIWRADRDWRRELHVTRESGLGVLITRMELDKQWPMRRGSDLTKVARVTVVECGWPSLGLAATHVVRNPDPQQIYPEENARWPASVPDDASNWQGAVLAPESVGGRPISAWRGSAPWFPLPFLVRPMGFTASTLFWLTVLVMPNVALRAARRALRRRRGLCPACAYDIRGLAACPKCGETAWNTHRSTARVA